MPSPVEKAAALARALTPQHQQRVQNAKRIIQDLLAKPNIRAYVGTSGGKDSTVVLHLARSVDPNLPAVHLDREWFTPGIREHVNTIPNLIRIAMRKRLTPWFTAWEDGPARIPKGTLWWEWEDREERAWATALGFNAALIGLRIDESAMRRKHLTHHGPLFYAEKNNAWHAHPLHDWSTLDVWAYILANDIPYCPAYTRLREIGVPLEQRRTGPVAVERVLWAGQLATLKRGWPQEFEAFAERHPTARKYA